MNNILPCLMILLAPFSLRSQKVAIGHTTPVTKLDVRGVASAPTIPGVNSTGVVRIANVQYNDAIDIGKLGVTPFTAWMQAGYDGNTLDPIIFNPLGGNVGIGVFNPTAKLDVNGPMKVNGKITNVSNPTNPQDAATKAYVDLLQARIAELIGIKDIDNNVYHTVTIGSQVWMTEDLRVTRYNDGTAIPMVTDLNAWSSLTTHAYTSYNNDASDYGSIYNFFTVVESNPKNVCPIGWHVPSHTEWNTLVTFLGGATVAGGKLKEAGLAHWNSLNFGATNESGFFALPGGQRNASGDFLQQEYAGCWWSSTANAGNAWYEVIPHYENDFYSFSDDPNFGNYVRCIKD